MLGSRTLVLTAVAAVLVVAGCGSTRGPEPTTPPEFLTFTDELGLFSISYPFDWRRSIGTPSQSITLPPQEDVVRSFIEGTSPRLTSTLAFLVVSSPRGPHINVSLTDSGATSLSELARERRTLAEEFTERTGQQWEVLGSRTTLVDGRNALTVDLEIDRLGANHQRWRELVIPSETIQDATWGITCTVDAEAGPFEPHLATCDQVMRSFRVLG